MLAIAAVGCTPSSPPSSSPSSPPRVEPPEPEEPSVTAQAIQASLDHASRPAAERDRDADRKPAQVLDFFGVGPGMQVAEMMAGRGYYIEILARVVGPSGRVYAHNSPFVLKRFAEQPLSERLAHPDFGHVIRLDRELDDPGLPVGELDAVLMILFYHDSYWMEVDRAKMNQAIFDSLKPGGVYGVIDHVAEPGSGDRDVKTIHRVDAELVKREILAAGFTLDADSDVLRNPADEHTINVFDPQIRGKTDRFVYRFRKPK